MAEVAVIVPVLNRPQNAAPFMESLRAANVDAEVVAVLDLPIGEDRDAWIAEHTQWLCQAGAHTYSQKVNAAYEWLGHRCPSWIFPVGDDVRFHPGWWQAIKAAHQQHGALVIGTNDLSGSAADHSPHLAIQRQYIDEQGASWSGPGVVCYKGYKHNFVDNEIISVAKQRGVWFMAHDAIVEHLHPVWGKGEDDDTYQLGSESHAFDRHTFHLRSVRYGGA